MTPRFEVKGRPCRSPNKSRERKYFSFYLKQKHIAYVFAFPLSTQTYSQIMPHGSSGTVRDYNVKTKKKKVKPEDSLGDLFICYQVVDTT